jgi:hypothetical protein
LKAEKSLDLAIGFIIDNSVSPWEAGDTYKTEWISGAKELQKYVKVNGHRAYVAMLPYFKRAETDIKNAISCEVYQDIIENRENEEYLEVVGHIKSYVSHKTLYNTIPRMMVYVEGDSLLFINNAEGITNGTGVYSKPNIEALEMLNNACLKDAAEDMHLITQTMMNDTATFRLYATYLKSITESKTILWTEGCHGEAVGGILLT